ncbi:1-deoxy-D-xylulose 5-phosphate reductoisomerase [compost metagenome]
MDAFHDGKIRFTDIVETVERALDEYTPMSAALSVETVLETDRWARAHATKIIEAKA